MNLQKAIFIIKNKKYAFLIVRFSTPSSFTIWLFGYMKIFFILGKNINMIFLNQELIKTFICIYA